MTGALIAFEGLDQSGKETQVGRLREYLEAGGRTVVSLAFPCYTTSIAHEIAEALQGRRHYSPEVLQLLFVANRYEYQSRIREWLDHGTIVLCDRYQASSIAYGEAQGLDPAWLGDVQRLLIQPDLTVLIDIAPGTAVTRKRTGRDRFERDLALLSRVRDSYGRLAAAPGWARIDGEQSIEGVACDVRRIIDERLARPSAH